MEQIKCKDCKFYVPYTTRDMARYGIEVNRGDGYCNIARMSECGMVTVNCNDDFYCADAERK